MVLYETLPDAVQEVDVIIAGGKHKSVLPDARHYRLAHFSQVELLPVSLLLD